MPYTVRIIEMEEMTPGVASTTVATVRYVHDGNKPPIEKQVSFEAYGWHSIRSLAAWCLSEVNVLNAKENLRRVTRQAIRARRANAADGALLDEVVADVVAELEPEPPPPPPPPPEDPPPPEPVP